jgi:hypothetical protein
MGVIIMKKFAMGVIVGAVLAFSASTYADDIAQMIGKQVDNEYPVVLNGATLNNRSVAIEGTSYAPVREISEKLGLNVKFENDTVILSKPQEVNNVPTKVLSKEEQIINLNTEINELARRIHAIKQSNATIQILIDTGKPDQNNDNYKKSIESNNAQITALEQQKADLEKQKAELLK